MPRAAAAAAALAAAVGGAPAPAAAWPAAVEDYRALLNALSKNTSAWAAAARGLRGWMQDNDPDYPLYHLAAPEGWNNDPNGITYDPHTGLYHRFYQYDPTYSDSKKHGSVPRTWGQTVSRDLAVWEDWPGIYADSPWDDRGVFSGNCLFNGSDPHPICIYSNNPCSIGVCAASHDGWVTWSKRACMNRAPSPKSQTNHDSSMWRDSDTGQWYLLSGGCTYNAPGSGADPNVPSPGHDACQGNAQLWTSPDLHNFTYVGPITPGGPGGYWELPYLLPFDADGNPLDNYHHEQAAQYVLAFGRGNSYWVGHYHRGNHSFVPLGAGATEATAAAAPAPAGLWPLSNGSGAATVGPAGVPSAVPSPTPGGVGSVFRAGAHVDVPHFAGLDAPQGFAFSALLQLPAPSGDPHAFVLGRPDDGWAVELWAGGVLNFFARRGAKAAGTYRAVQGPARTGEWVRVAGSYNASAPAAGNIHFYMDGAPIPDATTSPGAYAGPLDHDSAGLRIGGGALPGVYIADVAVYNVALAPAELAEVTAAPRPAPAPAPPAPWPAPRLSDTPTYYSINPHATDTAGPGGATRRLVFGWVEGAVSDASKSGAVPYWQSAHSLLRLMTVRGSYMVQLPAPEVERLRGAHVSAGPVTVSATGEGYLPGVAGDAVDIRAVFDLSGTNASTFGVVVRKGAGAATYIGYTPATTSIGTGRRGAGGWFAGIVPQQPGRAELRVFVDRSIVEVYCGGAAMTSRVALPAATARAAQGVDLWADGGVARLASLDAWQMGSMWGPVGA